MQWVSWDKQCYHSHFFLRERERSVIRNWLGSYEGRQVSRSVGWSGKLAIQGKADGLISFWCWRPANEESRWCSSCSKAGRFQTQEEQMFQLEFELGKGSQCPRSKAIRCEKFSLTLERVNLFVLFGVSTIWMRPNTTWEGNLLYSVYQCKC